MNDNDTISRKALLAQYDAEHQGPPGRARDLIVNAPAVPQEMSAREYVDVLERMFSEDHSAYDEWYEAMIGGDGELHERRHHAVAIVEQWAKDHPEKKRKTYAEDFNERNPHSMTIEGRPAVCRADVFDGKFPKDCDGYFTGDCAACWDEEMEEGYE